VVEVQVRQDDSIDVEGRDVDARELLRETASDTKKVGRRRPARTNACVYKDRPAARAGEIAAYLWSPNVGFREDRWVTGSIRLPRLAAY
jgi:hypothetical protein